MKQNLAETLEARSFHILATAAGFLVSLLLVWKHYSSLNLPFCSAASCDVVLNSRWSVFLGVRWLFGGTLMYGDLGNSIHSIF